MYLSQVEYIGRGFDSIYIFQWCESKVYMYIIVHFMYRLGVYMRVRRQGTRSSHDRASGDANDSLVTGGSRGERL